jgi:hypothetical protein
VEPLIWVRAGAVKLSPALMVSVPVLLKLAAVVEMLLLVPAMVSWPVLVARPASQCEIGRVSGDGLRRARQVKI